MECAQWCKGCIPQGIKVATQLEDQAADEDQLGVPDAHRGDTSVQVTVE